MPSNLELTESMKKKIFYCRNSGKINNRRRLNKYIAAFYYVDKSLMILSAASGEGFIASFATTIGCHKEIYYYSQRNMNYFQFRL